MITGMLGNSGAGFHNWTLSDAAAGTHAPFVGGFGAMLAVFLVAGFAFQGTEGVGLAAAETTNPAKSVPKAIRSVFLANPAVLYRRHFRGRHFDQLYRPESAQCRRKPHRLLAVHHGVPTAAALQAITPRI